MRCHVHLAVHGRHRQEVATVRENAGLFIQVDLAIFFHFEEVDTRRLDILGSALLAVR